ncbi:hypothetical protein MUP05_08265 [Candidatus Bathyarchaeota archaeon]|nr:hypothetical protein [Candidatus Bathyarchaeota archaeon]
MSEPEIKCDKCGSVLDSGICPICSFAAKELNLTEDELKIWASLLAIQYKNASWEVIHGKDRVLVGCAGEIAFWRDFKIQPHWALHSSGDQGVDFPTVIGTVDVKTFRVPIHLLVTAGKRYYSDIYVLASYDDETKKAKLLGWAWWRELEKVKPKDIGGFGVMSHYIRANKLHSIKKLHNLIEQGGVGLSRNMGLSLR